jgi:AmiR/NasT family two-component response regulator
VAARALLALQAHASPGALAAELEAAADFHFVVHHAAGMVAEQLGISIGEALARLRAYAFANDRLLTDVAEAVVGRRLRFDDQRPGGDPSQ